MDIGTFFEQAWDRKGLIAVSGVVLVAFVILVVLMVNKNKYGSDEVRDRKKRYNMSNYGGGKRYGR